MIKLRKASERGYAHHGWLESWHSFSFADYRDPAHVNFGPLRVINEDIVQPGTGFGTHGHRDMEILTYVLSGALRHRDSMGHGEDIRYGEVQVMSAGTGVQHSEVNPSPDEAVHLLQIWIMPDRQDLTPGYQQKNFPPEDKQARWRLLASPDAAQGSLLIRQDARIFAARLDGAETLDYSMAAQRKIYLHVARGSVQANGYALSGGDALMYTDETEVDLSDAKEAEVLLFDMG
ncbi:MAG: quercetin 2,3-dioxygenase [Betaproteobacteria bacterium RBG_16_56_24]|nr:MAG: quercetin 2,3-dioxygenase [Betaproteobacteria bacterium RBG_16_56_24]